MTDVTSFDDLTPEQIEEHMNDNTWGERLEGMVDRLLEDSSEQDKQDAYAIISMFTQTSYMGMMFETLKDDAVGIFGLAGELRAELEANNITSPVTDKWDATVDIIKQQVEARNDQ